MILLIIKKQKTRRTQLIKRRLLLITKLSNPNNLNIQKINFTKIRYNEMLKKNTEVKL